MFAISAPKLGMPLQVENGAFPIQWDSDPLSGQLKLKPAPLFDHRNLRHFGAANLIFQQSTQTLTAQTLL